MGLLPVPPDARAGTTGDRGGPTTALLSRAPVADANCDAAGTAADLVAAVLASGAPAAFPGCRGADPFRGRQLTHLDLLAVFHDLFATFDAPWTPTPTASRTPSGTPTPTRPWLPSPTASRTPTLTASPTFTASATPTRTPTRPPTPTPTVTRTATPTRTRTPTPSPTPTGIARQLAGDWAADWSGQICYLLGQPFDALRDVTYRITALDERLDIEIVGGVRLGRGLTPERDGAAWVVRTRYAVDGREVCALTGVRLRYDFEYTFRLAPDGRGAARAEWSYGANTNCASCRVTDTGTLRRIAGPP